MTGIALSSSTSHASALSSNAKAIEHFLLLEIIICIASRNDDNIIVLSIAIAFFSSSALLQDKFNIATLLQQSNIQLQTNHS